MMRLFLYYGWGSLLQNLQCNASTVVWPLRQHVT